jgi:hypothetical protein
MLLSGCTATAHKPTAENPKSPISGSTPTTSSVLPTPTLRLLRVTVDGACPTTVRGYKGVTNQTGNHYGFEGSEVVQESNGGYTPVSPVYVTGITGDVTQYSGAPAAPPASFSAGPLAAPSRRSRAFILAPRSVVARLAVCGGSR